jgi:hypothetical protein
MLSRPRLTEWLTILAILVILFSLGMTEYYEWRARRQYHDRITAFDGDMIAPMALRPDRVAADLVLLGRWVKKGHRSSSTLLFQKSPKEDESRYAVEFSTDACTTKHRLDRTAEYFNGQVRLDEPVAEVLGPVYQTLYSVRVGERAVLIPGTRSGLTDGILKAIRSAEVSGDWGPLKGVGYFRDGGEDTPSTSTSSTPTTTSIA